MASNNIITAKEIQDMVLHWIGTPPNGYLGSGYGSDIHSLLQQPMRSGMGDSIIAKMREDIPILNALPSGAINLFFLERDFESKTLIIEVLGEQINIEIPRTIA